MVSSNRGIPIGNRSVATESLGVGTERMAPGAFYKRYCCWQDGDVSAVKFKPFPPKECLPMGSCLHLLDNFYALETREPISDICSFDVPFVNNEPMRKLLYNQIVPMTDGWIKTPKDYIFRTAQLARNIERFWATNAGRFLKKMQLSDLNTKDSALCIVNHNPIFRLFVRGPMQNWRTTMHYFASVFNTIAAIPQRTHYVVIPLADKIFSRGMFNQLANKVSASSIRDKQSLQYCLFAQLYNFLNVNCTLPTMFDDIPEEFRKKITLVFENSGHYLFWPLQTLKDLNIRNKIFARSFNHFNGFILRGLAEKNAKANTLDDMDSESESAQNKDVELEIIKSYSQITKIPVKDLVADETETVDDDGDNDYISTADAAELDELTRKVKTVPLTMGERATVLDITDVNEIIEGEQDDSELSVSGTPGNHPLEDGGSVDQGNNAVVPDPSDPVGGQTDEARDVHGQEDFYTEESLGEVRLPGTDVVPFESGNQVAEAGRKYLAEVDASAAHRIQNDRTLTQAQKDRALRMSQSYKDVMIGNKTIEQILTAPVNPKLDEEEITNLPETVVPDRSMCKSSIDNMDAVYMERMFTRHLAGTVASMAAQGMYLQDVEKHVTNTELTQTQDYIARYKTVSGKQHTIRFSMPIVRPDGTFLLNGVRSTASKQLTTKPIAKLTPTRVSLASNYNKTIVEKLSSTAHDYQRYFTNLIEDIRKEDPKAITNLEYGIRDIPGQAICGYEYWQIAQKFHSFIVHHKASGAVSYLYFGAGEDRYQDPVFKDAKISDRDWENIQKYENEHKAIFIGARRGGDAGPYAYSWYFMDIGSKMVILGQGSKDAKSATSIMEFLCAVTDFHPKRPLTEWTDIKILDAKFPVGFLLCYRFGLLNVLRRLKVKYEIIGRQAVNPVTHIAIPFSDKKIVIPRYPLKTSLILQGLRMFDTKQGAMEDYDHKDIYFQLLLDKRMGAGRTNYLIGIDDTFDMFVDPMTYDRLLQMNEPTTFGGLLVRATEMLSVPYHLDSSAMANHCLRSYERMNGILYNEMSAQMRIYKKQRGNSATFSIKPNAVLQRIVQDQSVMPVEDINPIHDIKTSTKLTYLGMGGRTSESITVNDRRFPPDGLGIVSESTPSAGNVGVVVQSTMDPRIDNLSGLMNTKDEGNLEPTQILSATGLYMPTVTQDDGKRVQFASNFASHTVPTKEGEVLRVRTGFEAVIAHRCNDLYAYTAKNDGTVLDVNEKLGMVKIQYKDGRIESFSFETQYGQCSDLLVEQQQKLTIKKGDKFKKHDVLRYNPQFFIPNPDVPRQVDYVHGVTAKIAILENSLTFNDSNAVSAEMSERLGIAPVVDRLITIPAKATIHGHVKLGDPVDINTPLVIFERDDTTDLTGVGVDDAALAYLEGLNRSAPKAKNVGKIVDIKVLHACDLSDMHPSMSKMVSEYTSKKKAVGKYISDSTNQYLFAGDSQVPEGSKYKGITLDNETVILQYYIQEGFDQGSGDKITLDSSLKTVTCIVIPEAPVTENGTKIDCLFSGESISHRIVNSPILVGVAECVMETVEKQCLDLYFKGGKGAEALEAGGQLSFRKISKSDLHNKDTVKVLDEMSEDFFGSTSTTENWITTKDGWATYLFVRNDPDGKEEIIGFVTVHYSTKPTDGKNVGFIRFLNIREKFRGQGYGSKLFPDLLKLMKQEKNCTAIRIAHLVENKPAAKLYTKNKCEPVAEWWDIRPDKTRKDDTLPTGWEFLSVSYLPTAKELKSFEDFLQKHKKDILPEWAMGEESLLMVENKGILYKKDLSGNIVAFATISNIGDSEPYFGELWYPVANTKADFDELISIYRSLPYLKDCKEFFVMAGNNSTYRNELKKIGKVKSIVLARKL